MASENARQWTDLLAECNIAAERESRGRKYLEHHIGFAAIQIPQVVDAPLQVQRRIGHPHTNVCMRYTMYVTTTFKAQAL